MYYAKVFIFTGINTTYLKLSILQACIQFLYCISQESFYCVSDKTQALYWILLTAKYRSSDVAAYCLEAHKKALNDTIGNLSSPSLSYCMNTAGVGNIYISNITSTSHSFDVIIHFVSLS